MVTSFQTVRWLSGALVVLAIVSAVVTLLVAVGILFPPVDIQDLIQRLEAFRANDARAFPVAALGSLATLGVFLVGAMLGVALRPWARPSSLRDAMTLLFVIGGIVGIVAQLLNLAFNHASTFGICDCNYKAEELIAQDYALSLGFTAVSWLAIGAITLTGIGVALAGRLVEVGAAWRTLSYVIAAVLVFAVALRVLAAFVFVPIVDPFQVSDLAVAFAAGVLVPIWAILLARGADRPALVVEPAAA